MYFFVSMKQRDSVQFSSVQNIRLRWIRILIFHISAVICKQRKLHENLLMQSFRNHNWLEVRWVNFGKFSLRPRNLKVWWPYHWHIKTKGHWIIFAVIWLYNFWTKNNIKLITIIIERSHEHVDAFKISFLFNEPLKVYCSFYFTTFLMKSICHIFASYGTT